MWGSLTRLRRNRARGRREHVVCVAADQPNGSDHQNQDDGQHDRIFGNILALLLGPDSSEEFTHNPLRFAPSFHDERGNPACQTEIVTNQVPL